MGTSFLTIYDSFLSRIESSMYMELTELDTIELLQELLVNAIPRFKLPRFDIFDYEIGYFEHLGSYTGVESVNQEGIPQEVPAYGWVGGNFNSELTFEEINILSLAMVVEWLGQQLATTELARMKFSGTDFKMTSQANHMAKLKVLMDKYEAECKTLQDNYKRRKRQNGKILSTIGQIMEVPSYGYKI